MSARSAGPDRPAQALGDAAAAAHTRRARLRAGTSIGSWLGGFFGAFVAALLSIPVAGALQVIARELWQITGQPGPADGGQAAGPDPPVGDQQASGTDWEPYDGGRQAGEGDAAAPVTGATTSVFDHEQYPA